MQPRKVTSAQQCNRAVNRRFHALAVKEACGTATAAETAELERLNRARNPLPPLYGEWMAERDMLSDRMFLAFSPLIMCFQAQATDEQPQVPRGAVAKFSRAADAYHKFIALGFGGWKRARRKKISVKPKTQQ